MRNLHRIILHMAGLVSISAAIVFLVSSASISKPAKSFPVTPTDALGRKIMIAKKPERIVSLSPAITETLFMLGAGKAVVGRTDFCNYPKEAEKKKTVG